MRKKQNPQGSKYRKMGRSRLLFPFSQRNANQEEAQPQGERLTKPAVSKPALEEAAAYASDIMDKAIKMAHEKRPAWEETSEYPYLIATLIQTMHGHITNIEIAAQDEKKYKMWGKKV
jgi:hypothetical protein